MIHKNALILSLIILLLGFTSSKPPSIETPLVLSDDKASDKSRPNVILIMADDLGWGDVGFNGHPYIKTPYLDQMAANGAQLNRFYAAGPVCSPTRGSVLTGRNPNRFGVRSANSGHLREQEITLAELFRSKGYDTAHFGKWHLGTLYNDFSGKGPKRKPEENFMNPSMAGFDYWFSTEFSIATYNPYIRDKEHAHSNYWLKEGDKRVLFVENGDPVDELKGCASEMVMDKVLPFIETSVKKQNPFFTVVWFHAPHTPVIGHPRYMKELYADRPEEEQHYFSVITALDAQVGRLREKLSDLGIADNTIICFTSDNGPEGNPDVRKRSRGSTAGLRGRKRSLYEGGIRVPSVIEWPSGIRPGTIVETPAVTSDYFPTFSHLLSEKLPNRPIDGVNLLEILKGEKSQRDRPIGFYFNSHKQRVLIDDRYKLVHNYGKNRPSSDNSELPSLEFELYDIIEDQYETNNIIAEYSEIAESMKTKLRDFVDSCENSFNRNDY